MYSINIIFYNEKPYLKDFLNKVINFCEKNFKVRFEINLIDDCSTDLDIIDVKEITSYPKTYYYKNLKNLGYAASTQIALEKSNFEHIFILDGDGEYPVENLNIFIKILQESPDIILPIRKQKYKNLERRVGSFILTFFCKKFLKYPKKDINGGIKYLNSKNKNYFKFKFNFNLVNPEVWSIGYKNNLKVYFASIDRLEKKIDRKSKIFKNKFLLFFKISYYIYSLRKLYIK